MHDMDELGLPVGPPDRSSPIPARFPSSYHISRIMSMICSACFAPDFYRSSSTWRQSFVTMSTRPINPASTCWSPEDKLSPFHSRFVGIDGPEEFFSKVDTGRESHRGVSITANRSFFLFFLSFSLSLSRLPRPYRLSHRGRR